ncbi:MAG TPA: hypothetical protein VG426_12585 [Candidatus Dormibacteraeota bacterium]|nr:hypothetical protein [Candidatus Dormibacteraeota bacterium]
MSDQPPAYPPPPEGPPADYPPPPGLPPAERAQTPLGPPSTPYPPGPAYGYAPAPPVHRASASVRAVIASVVVVVVLLVGVIGYGLGGYAFGSSRISDVTGAINSVQAHRSYVNTTFDLLDQQVATLEASTDPTAAKSTSGQLVTESQGMQANLAGDDQALVSARSRLNDQQWLTALSKGRLAAAAGRIDHARQAVASLESAAGGIVQLGQFFQGFFQALVDARTMLAAAGNNDLVGTVAADGAFQADSAKAMQVPSPPGLPHEYQDFLVVLQAYAADFGKELNARDTATFNAAHDLVMADIAKLNAVNFTGTAGVIQNYYQKYRDTFNVEMDKATA